MTHDDPEAYVSTGALPPPETVAAFVREAYDRYRSDTEGRVATVYPALARVPPDLFGLSVAGTTGAVYSAGDAEVRFALMSVAKPFVFALVGHELGWDEARARVGVNATGLPFNSLEAVARSGDGRTNPMVNPGALATTSLARGASHEERWTWLLSGLSAFAGTPLALDDGVYESSSETNQHNRIIAGLLAERGRLFSDPEEALDLYTRQSSVSVCTVDLAVMGATLADGGVNPVTRERVVSETACRRTLAVMATAGLYETSGDWLYDVGLPGKSGLGGGIVTVSPGKGALGTYGPRLDAAGNSVTGRHAARFLSSRLGLNMFASRSEPAGG